MADIINSDIKRQEYTAFEGSNLLGKTTKVLLALAPGNLLAGGFSDNGNFMSAAGYNYDTNGEWISDFFEHQFLNERLLADASKVTHIFIATHKGMLVPKAFHREETSEKWLRDIFFVEKEERISFYAPKEDKAYYTFAIPAAVKDLVARYFPKAKLLPFAAHQFDKHYKSGHTLLCSLTGGLAFVTFYSGRAIHWNQVFSYTNAEDIAYQVKAYLADKGIDHAAFQFAAISNDQSSILEELLAYFPDMTAGSTEVKEEQWKPTVNLLQQLYKCV